MSNQRTIKRINQILKQCNGNFDSFHKNAGVYMDTLEGISPNMSSEYMRIWQDWIGGIIDDNYSLNRVKQIIDSIPGQEK